jgi:hypothetical protein
LVKELKSRDLIGDLGIAGGDALVSFLDEVSRKNLGCFHDPKVVPRD